MARLQTKLGCQFEITKFRVIFRVGSSYWGPSPSHQASVKPKAEIPDTSLLAQLVISQISQLQSLKMWVWVLKLTRNNEDGISKMLWKWCLANGKCMKMLSCPSQDPRPMERKSIIRAIPCELRETPRIGSQRSFGEVFGCMKSPNFLKQTSILQHFEGES